jgi:hypothetical protein
MKLKKITKHTTEKNFHFPMGNKAQAPVVVGKVCTHSVSDVNIICQTCNSEFPCICCHQELFGHDHVVRVKLVKCRNCDLFQKPSSCCGSRSPSKGCGKRFAHYYCLKCKLWDKDDFVHCDFCNSCFNHGSGTFHCNRCNTCLPMSLGEGHIHIENRQRALCAICKEIVFNWCDVSIASCGHDMHQSCRKELMKRDYRCPICKITLLKEKAAKEKWCAMKNEIRETPMPLTRSISIMCNDCSSKSDAIWHIVGNACDKCGSFNTSIL